MGRQLADNNYSRPSRNGYPTNTGGPVMGSYPGMTGSVQTTPSKPTYRGTTTNQAPTYTGTTMTKPVGAAT